MADISTSSDSVQRPPRPYDDLLKCGICLCVVVSEGYIVAEDPLRFRNAPSVPEAEAGRREEELRFMSEYEERLTPNERAISGTILRAISIMTDRPTSMRADLACSASSLNSLTMLSHMLVCLRPVRSPPARLGG